MRVRQVGIGPEQAVDPRIEDVVARVLGDAGARTPAGWPGAARDLGAVLPRPGEGRTTELWSVLATVAAEDLQLARAVEPHLDALAILAEAGAAGFGTQAVPSATWGVFAAESGGVRLTASNAEGAWRLEGTKPWCSLADRLSHALVTAWRDDDSRGLFAVDLTDRGVVTSPPASWEARGLRDVVSLPVTMSGVPAHPVGPPGWYLERDGFAWGGMGVAAVWYGGAVGLVRRLLRPSPRTPDQVALLHLGRVDRQLTAARSVLHGAARDVDSGRAAGADGALLAHRVRAVVAGVAEDVLEVVGHALGPGPMVSEPDHAARIADLGLYLRQHHAERDLVALGGLVAERPHPW